MLCVLCWPRFLCVSCCAYHIGFLCVSCCAYHIILDLPFGFPINHIISHTVLERVGPTLARKQQLSMQLSVFRFSSSHTYTYIYAYACRYVPLYDELSGAILICSCTEDFDDDKNAVDCEIKLKAFSFALLAPDPIFVQMQLPTVERFESIS